MSLNYGTNLTFRSERYARSPERGRKLFLQYEGSREAVMTLALTMGDQVSWETDDSEAPKWKLSAQTPDELDVLTIWELQGMDMSKSIYQHPTSMFDVSAADLAAIKKFDEEGGTAPTVTGDAANALLYLIKHKEDSYNVSRFVLRGRSVGRSPLELAGNSPVILPHLVNTLFGITEILAGGIFDLHLPATMQAYISEIVSEELNTTEAEANGFYWSWLFKTPSLIGLPGGKFELRQEWWLGLWSSYHYALANPPPP